MPPLTRLRSTQRAGTIVFCFAEACMASCLKARAESWNKQSRKMLFLAELCLVEQ